MNHKVITLQIIAFDGYEAEGINDAIGNILEREDWRLYSWTTTPASPDQVDWFKEEERRIVRADLLRNAADYDPRIDHPERYGEGPV